MALRKLMEDLPFECSSEDDSAELARRMTLGDESHTARVGRDLAEVPARRETALIWTPPIQLSILIGVLEQPFAPPSDARPRGGIGG